MGRLLTALLLALALPAVSLVPYPRTSFAPATVRLRIHVTPDPRNRTLAWACDGGDYFTAEEVTLDGDHAPTLFVRDLRDLWPGEYECRSVVARSDGSTATASSAFTVMGRE